MGMLHLLGDGPLPLISSPVILKERDDLRQLQGVWSWQEKNSSKSPLRMANMSRWRKSNDIGSKEFEKVRNAGEVGILLVLERYFSD